MDEKTCETCRYIDKRADQEPCNSCTIEDGDKWERPDPDEYVKEVFNRRYAKQH